MRRTIAALTLALTVAVSGTLAVAGTGTAATADDERPVPAGADRTAARQSLSVTERILDGRPTRSDPSATIALRDLWRSLPGLTGAERRRAEAILARPTDGAGDPFGFGYTVPATKKCASNVCVHWVTSTADAPPSRRWVNTTLPEMQYVWRVETGRLGYRKPLRDGKRGGNKKFDVYLKDVGAFGLYGYCAAEERVQRFLASGYCVLDNNFARAQFPSSPKKSLKVTAAHEFFHAVQYAYDAEDDRWLLEATATWMEERVADGANDNRQYLPFGQVKDPASPLDTYAGGALNQYGNWVFFEFLSKRFGPGVVRQIWSKMAADKKSPDLYSTQAIVRVLKSRGGFKKLFSEYAAGNTIPGKTYPEGNKWPSAAVALNTSLSKSSRSTGTVTSTLNHLSSSNVVLRPARSLKQRSWKVRVKIDGPKRKSSPSAYVLVDKKRGPTLKRLVRLDGKGRASVKVDFSRREVKKVTITLVNSSTRFRCFRQAPWSCSGNPKDDGQMFELKAVVRK
ncbi:MAG: MXAN_6640 family putative metalloprotease [Nocardioides sp.]